MKYFVENMSCGKQSESYKRVLYEKNTLGLTIPGETENYLGFYYVWRHKQGPHGSF